jgi:hypothetical protein
LYQYAKAGMELARDKRLSERGKAKLKNLCRSNKALLVFEMQPQFLESTRLIHSPGL